MDDDDLDAIMAQAGIDYTKPPSYDHYSYEDEQPLTPYDGVEDFSDHLPPMIIVAFWAIIAIAVGLLLLSMT